MSNLKKCPNCGQWSQWNQNLEDRCEHCKALLSPEEVKDAREEAERASREDKYKFEVKLIEIKPEDNFLIQYGKRIIQGFQLLFVGIISFLIWLATLIAG